jgi:hypothetical protein
MTADDKFLEVLTTKVRPVAIAAAGDTPSVGNRTLAYVGKPRN